MNCTTLETVPFHIHSDIWIPAFRIVLTRPGKGEFWFSLLHNSNKQRAKMFSWPLSLNTQKVQLTCPFSIPWVLPAPTAAIIRHLFPTNRFQKHISDKQTAYTLQPILTQCPFFHLASAFSSMWKSCTCSQNAAANFYIFTSTGALLKHSPISFISEPNLF